MLSVTTRRAPRSGRRALLGVTLLVWLGACDQNPTSQSPPPEGTTRAIVAGGAHDGPFRDADPSGTIATTGARALDLRNPFFQSLGTNGRSCASCHIIENGLGLSASYARGLFATTGGKDPLFAVVDGANCPDAAPGSGPDAHSLLINNGLIRIGITQLPITEYALTVVHDPYQCAVHSDPTGTTVSVYRRPLPSTNLRFLTAVMFDGRETVNPLNSVGTFAANLRTDLGHQAVDATLGHAQATAAPTGAQVRAIVDFELSLSTAQSSDVAAGELTAAGAQGGPGALVEQRFYPGINDPLGGNPTGAAFDPSAMTIFRRWLGIAGHGRETAARQAVARGEQVFDTHPLLITGVKGLNDALGVATIPGTCTTCHNAPNVGDHSLPLPLDIGTSHALQYEQDPNILAALAQLSSPDLPVYQVSCGGTNSFTTDPGRALITGKCADVGRIKGPILRGLAARAPYFHNGAAASLGQVVAFYNARFQMGLTPQEQSDLVAFLSSL
jgi:cytochrome c peroxidase